MFNSFKKNEIPINFNIETFENTFNKLNLIINKYVINPQKKNLNIKGEGSYIHMLNKYRPDYKLKNDDIILEIGSRDALDAIDLYNKFKCSVYAFECNPTAIEIMKQNINYHIPENEKVSVVEYAINNLDNKNVDFYPTIIDNIGASSIFKLIQNSNNQEIIDHTNRHLQKHIKVETIRLDSWINKYNIEYYEYTEDPLKKLSEYKLYDPIDHLILPNKYEKIDSPNFLINNKLIEKYRKKTDKFYEETNT